MKDLLKKLPDLSQLRERLLERKTDRVVAIDINNYQIKLVVMTRAGVKLQLDTFHIESMGESEAEGTPGLDSAQRDGIAQMVKEYGLHGSEAVVSLPYAGYSIRLVVLPKMKRKELAGAIRLDLMKSGKLGPDTVVEFVTVDSFEQEGVQYENHLVAIVNRERLVEVVGFLAGLGLRVRGFSVVPLSLKNVLMYDERIEKGKSYAVVNMSHEETSFSMIHDDKLLFTRDVPKTGRELLDAMQTIVVPGGDTVHISRERANEIRYEYGIIDESSKGETTDDGISLENIAIMMRPVLEKMLVEIRRSIDFCQEQFGIVPPDTLFLAGGGSQLKNLRDYLAARLRMNVEYIDSTRGYELGPFVNSEAVNIRSLSLAAAIGAALNVNGGNSYFVPREFIEPDYRFVRMSLRLAAAAAVIAVGAAMGFSQLSAARSAGQMKNKLATVERLNEIHRQYQTDAEELRLQKFRRDTLLSLIGPEVPWGNVLMDLSHRVNVNVQLTNFETVQLPVPETEGVVENRIKFKGLISLERERLEAVTSRLLEQMNASPYFDDIRLEGVRSLDSDVASVDFSCRLLF